MFSRNKPTDLSVRQPVPRAALPQFQNQQRNASTVTGTGELKFFNTGTLSTVQWVLAQIDTACTIQLLLNGQPFGLALALDAGSVIRFAGCILPNNGRLSFLITGATVNVNFEIAWTNGNHPQLVSAETEVVYQPLNIGNFPNPLPVTGPLTDAQLAARLPLAALLTPVARIETTTPLGSNGVFTGAWHDRTLDGVNFVEAVSRADQNGLISGFVLQQSDDITNVNLTMTTHTFSGNTGGSTPGAGRNCLLFARLFARYWRVMYTNGAVAQASFELTTTAQVFDWTFRPQRGDSPYSFNISSDEVLPVFCMGLASFNTYQDNAISTNVLPFPSYQQSGPAQVAVEGTKAYGGAFSGTTDLVRRGWSFQRTPTVFRRIAATATGSTALWTPGTGNKFRLLRLFVEITNDAKAAAAADLVIKLLDSATDINIDFMCFIPTAAATTLGPGYSTGWIDLGSFGILSAAINNVLNVNLSFALTGGSVNVIACGVEE